MFVHSLSDHEAVFARFSLYMDWINTYEADNYIPVNYENNCCSVYKRFIGLHFSINFFY
jgi:hypothetical protein